MRGVLPNRWWGRFDQPDPYEGSYDLADPQSFNRYAYVQNDPVNFVDPTGLLESWNFCSAQYSFADCGGWAGVSGGYFGSHYAELSRLYEGIPEHARESYTRYLGAVNPGAFAHWLPREAHYIGNLTWGYSAQTGPDTYVVYSITLSYDRLRGLVFHDYYGFGWGSGGIFRDVYGGLHEPGIDMHPAVDPVWMAAGILAGGVVGGLRGGGVSALPKGIAASFTGNIHRIVLRQHVVAYRYSGGVSDPIGRWLTTMSTVRRIGQTGISPQSALALPPGATAAQLNVFIIPKGTEIFVGRVAGAPWATQIFVRNPAVLRPGP